VCCVTHDCRLYFNGTLTQKHNPHRRYGGNMQAPHREAPAGIRTRNPFAVRRKNRTHNFNLYITKCSCRKTDLATQSRALISTVLSTFLSLEKWLGPPSVPTELFRTICSKNLSLSLSQLSSCPITMFPQYHRVNRVNLSTWWHLPISLHVLRHHACVACLTRVWPCSFGNKCLKNRKEGMEEHATPWTSMLLQPFLHKVLHSLVVLLLPSHSQMVRVRRLNSDACLKLTNVKFAFPIMSTDRTTD